MAARAHCRSFTACCVAPDGCPVAIEVFEGNTGDAIPQIATAPAHNAIFRQIRAILDPPRQVSHLRIAQTGCGAGSGAIRQPSQPFGVVAMHPVAQCLSVHAARLSRQ
jgi:hypothetical protein